MATRKNRKTKGNKTLKQNSYVVVIPSYGRAKLLKKKTLSMLEKGGVSKKQIIIFVANEEEKREYENNNPDYTIIVGKPGITEQRNFIVNYLEEGTRAVFIDDDVAELLKMEGDRLVHLKNVNGFIKKGFKEAKKRGFHLWGIYPVRNAYFMKPRPTIDTGLSFILGTFYGQIIRHDKTLLPHVKEKEDIENSILHYKKDGGVLRFNKITLRTKFNVAKGGLGILDDERKRIHKDAAEYLEKKYYKYGHIMRRPNGKYEFRLKLRKEN